MFGSIFNLQSQIIKTTIGLPSQIILSINSAIQLPVKLTDNIYNAVGSGISTISTTVSDTGFGVVNKASDMLSFPAVLIGAAVVLIIVINK